MIIELSLVTYDHWKKRMRIRMKRKNGGIFGIADNELKNNNWSFYGQRMMKRKKSLNHLFH